MKILDINSENLKSNYIKIENLKQFKIDIPQLHPDDPRYEPTWWNIKKRVIEGYWGYEFGKYRYCPPQLQFYSTFGRIYDTDANKNTFVIKPRIDDIEWEISYYVFEAMGFSGFYGDDKFTCDKSIFDVKKTNVPNTPVNNARFYTSTGKFKEFITPEVYLKMLHEKDMGQPLYYNEARNALILGSRGGGKSYIIALGFGLHCLVTDGAKYYKESDYYRFPDYNLKMIGEMDNKIRKYPNLELKSEVIIGSADTDKSSEFCSKIINNMRELEINPLLGAYGDPDMNKDTFRPSPLFKEMAGNLDPGNKKNPYRHEYKLLSGGREIKKGSSSKIYHVSYSPKKQSAAQAGAGGRYNFSIIEEVGLSPNSIDIHQSNHSAVSRNGVQFGVQVDIGTSGNIAMIQQTKKMFNNPQDYFILERPDEYENNTNISFFLSFALTLRQYKDENGNTDFNKVYKHIAKIRNKAAESSDPKVLLEEKMNRPIVPSEMWISSKGYLLPFDESVSRESKLLENDLYKTIGTPIKLSWDSTSPNGVKYKIDHDAEPFYAFPFDKVMTSLEGCITMYEKPQIPPGHSVVPNDMYNLIGHDPYVADDIDKGGSIATAYIVMNPKYITAGYNGNTIVASYIGKPLLGRTEYYKNLEKLLAFYGNPVRGLWYEANAGEKCREHFVGKNKASLLCLRPQLTKGNSAISKYVTNYGYIVGNRHSKLDLIQKVSEWLLEETTLNDGTKLNIERIPCIFLIRQMKDFNLDGNFDAVMGFVGCVLGYFETLASKEQEIQDKIKKQTVNSLNKFIPNANNRSKQKHRRSNRRY